MNQDRQLTITFEEYLSIKKYAANTFDAYCRYYKIMERNRGREPLSQYVIDLFISNYPHSVGRAFIKAYLKYLKHIKNPIYLDLEIPEIRGVVQRKNPEWLEEKEVAQLISNCDRDDFKLLIAIMFETGLRISEAIALRKSDIDFTHGFVTGIGKRKKEFKLQISQNTALFLEQYYLKDKLADFKLFDFTRQRAWQLFQSLGKRVLNKRIHPHMIRHSTATRLLDKGCNLVFIQAIMRHDNIKDTAHYSHVKDKAVAAQMKQILNEEN